MLEGTRAFDLAWGATTGLLCFSVAVPVLWWVLPGHLRSFFGTRIDPHARLQLAYGIFAMAMAFTNVLCRAIPHAYLDYVHETFALMTAVLLATMGPRVAYMLLENRRSAPAAARVRS